MSTNKPEQFGLHMNAEEIHNSSSSDGTEITHREQYPNSPFWIIGNPEIGYFLALGDNRLTEMYPQIQDVRNHIMNHSWELILQMCHIIFTKLTQDKEILKLIP